MIRLHHKIFYGVHELSIHAVEVFLRLYLLVHFADQVKLPPWMTGVALLLSLLWDAWIEPWVGRQSDSWFASGRSRWIWVLAGSLLSGFALICLFSIPPEWGPIRCFLALLGASFFLNTALAFASVPYSALVGDVRGNAKDQSHLIGWRLGFGSLGSLLGIAIPGFFMAAQDPAPFVQSAWAFTILLFLLAFLSSLSRPAFLPMVHEFETLPEWKPTLRQLFLFRFPRPPRGILPFLAAGFVLNVGLTLNSSTALPFYKHALQFSETQVQSILLLFFACLILFIPFWIWLGHRWGQVRALLLGGSLLGVSTSLMYYFFQPGEIMPVLIVASSWGGFCVGCSVLAERILTDMGKISPQVSIGYVFGLWKMSAKMARAFGMAFAGFALSWAGIQGFDPRIGDRLTLVFGPGVGVLLLSATLILFLIRKDLPETPRPAHRPRE